MKISFHGAARTVTGSKHILTLPNGKKLLLDCGMYQGMGSETPLLNNDFGFNPEEIDFMILSHSHIDHCGLVPKLVKDGYQGKIYVTDASKALAAILLEDSANIQESDANYENKRRKLLGREYVQPLYNISDALVSIDRFEVVPYQIWYKIEDGLEFMFTDAGHLIGSTCVHVRVNDRGKTRQITFSGDLGRYRDVILKSPETFPQADVVILESTYGNKLHRDVVTTPDMLLDWIERTCLQKKGKLIMPAFSVGRTQEILFALNTLYNQGKLPKLQYFVDSPLSHKATILIQSYSKYFNSRMQKVMAEDKSPFVFEGLRFTKSVDESKQLNFLKEPCVIISASGMAEAGRIKHHISNNVENSRNTILFTGYCEPNSLGGRLKTNPEVVTIFGMEHQVNAEIGSIDSMSAHGDYEDMLQWLGCQDPKAIEKIFLVHGEYEVQVEWRNLLLRKGFYEVHIPERHQEYGLG